MANKRISTQEIAEILIKNIGKLEQIIKTMEVTAARTTQQIKAVSGSTLKVEKPDTSDIINLVVEMKQHQRVFLNQNKNILDKVTELKNKNKTRLPNNLIYTLIGFSLFCMGFVFFAFKIYTSKQLKETTKERDYYLKVLQNIPKKVRDKYINEK